jgi:rfaE bifunctional protein nucleotidyltransferase chain/domain
MPADPAAKIVDAERARRQREGWRRQGRRTVFTNGVFDLLHRGHVEYLAEARSLGDHLVVGVNSDASVRRLGKGSDRPLNSLPDRLAVLAALAAVDLVVPFEEDTPLELIRLLEPDVLVKGGDYTETTVVGADLVHRGGGEVVIIPLRPGFSTTRLLERLREGGEPVSD